MIIGIDHGNRNIKTPHCVFTSGFTSSEKESDMESTEVLNYNGRYYAIATEPFNVENDKSVSENFFILSLFAIAKEMEATKQKETECNITLAVGLPPRDFARLKEKYEQYFLKHFKNGVEFSYNNITYNITSDRCIVFPQGYAAAMSSDKASYITNYSTSFIIDIGGFTVDYMEFDEKKLNKDRCGSEPCGVIAMIDHIISRVSSKFGRDITYKMAEGIIAGRNVFMSDEIKDFILNETQKWVDDRILGTFTKKNIDLSSYPVVMIGGGSALLKKYIDQSNKITIHEYVEDICANAKGYLLFASKLAA